MDKYKKGIVSEVKKEKEQEKKQEELHEKYHVDPSVLIVEKPSAYTFTIKLLINTAKTLGFAALCFLAAIGTITLLYPALRGELELILLQLLNQIRGIM